MRGWQENGIGYWSLSSIEGCRCRGGATPPVPRPDVLDPVLPRRPGGLGVGLAVEAACEAVAVAEALHPDWPVLARTRPANGPAVRVAEGAGLTQRSDLDAGGFVVLARGWQPTQYR